jgi:hypothetical protein
VHGAATLLAARRLINQQIAATTCTTPAEIAAHLLAMQAQDYLGTLWAVGLRLPGSTERTVEAALDDRSLVRTWPLRGTLHMVAAADVAWLLDLLAPRQLAKQAGRRKQLGIDEETLARSREVCQEALQGGKQLERGAMFATLETHGISTAGQRGIHIFGHLAQAGLLCLGARSGKQFTFTLLDEWVPHARTLPRDEALLELARRYFTGHGPATVQDFAWWAGLTLTDARAALAAATPHLHQEEIDGQTYWQAPPSAGLPDTLAASLADAVHLLPGFDEYLLSYTDRRAVLDPQFAERTHPGANGMMLPVIVLGGRVVGVWKRTIKRKAVNLVFSPFEPLAAAQQDAVAVTAQRYGQFLELPVIVDWQDVTR